MIDLNVNLTTNFRLWELVKSSTADRLGIDNTPNAEEIGNLRKLCEKILQPARDALGPIKILSGFRSEKINKAVGGVSNSDHRLGFAADVIPVSVSTRKLAEWVAQNCPEFDQVILEFGKLDNPNWIHLSAAPRNRKQVLRATHEDGRVVYRPIALFG
ncbi:D-Ala-D-Ala carboxypeptidase family metallohydrolase [Microcoleus sp. w2-18bC1]|uniref:D-Ala-D-Ala carboxypeptidase family metallohydrolase n=1 Tax=unclassified Microcoleus TaxID=2642155 RepID=UPI002FD43690